MSEKQEAQFSEESFEFIDTPSVAAPAPAGAKYGVKTTAVSVFGNSHLFFKKSNC